jgi:hypothetical protein
MATGDGVGGYLAETDIAQEDKAMRRPMHLESERQTSKLERRNDDSPFAHF